MTKPLQIFIYVALPIIGFIIGYLFKQYVG
jgi:hypothetical protein